MLQGVQNFSDLIKVIVSSQHTLLAWAGTAVKKGVGDLSKHATTLPLKERLMNTLAMVAVLPSCANLGTEKFSV